MSDLRTLMHQAVGPMAVTPENWIVDADLARAQRARRRRRAGRLGAGSGIVAAATLGTFAIVTPGILPGSTSSATTAAGKSGTAKGAGTSVTPMKSTALISYTGKQPVGFILDKVPAGWEVKDANPAVLTLAPIGAKTPASGQGFTSFVGKIAISQEQDTGVPSGIPLDPVTVAGHPAVIAHMKGDDTRTLFLKQPSGAYLNIQVWSGLGWNNSQITEFAAGVHVTKDAQLSAG
jgi:hypothetical protein